MQKELAPHESDLISHLRQCAPGDEVTLLVKDTRESGMIWVVMTARNSKRVLQVKKDRVSIDS